ncbi:hypothetical protein D9619_001427 [Psilocybe cf. subviscida]|uniref:Hyaluronan-mediated motility receptor C-terminal domain-containing protein n=1 Tax=Psilocybe cf. subviscida TaxID=2480587 RepID=A0A8H5BDP5_9AGAR|nr:hypothetical protein D9619_001427 [Psilocybe cf. subviscida]
MLSQKDIFHRHLITRVAVSQQTNTCSLPSRLLYTMFPKGPRFEPMKVPEVPGPNAYTLPQESALDNYKRGAFLEKADRFSKDKIPMPAGPSSKPLAGATTRKPSSDHSATERYQLLQKKVDDLEKVHAEGKRVHQVELEKLKQELAASQKLAAENADRAEKQKKQNAVLDARMQEMKRGASTDQSEIKDLKHKLRMLEMDRDKLSSKQPEILELKKTLATAEAKRKEEAKDRDRRIAELEKQLAAEQRKREAAETKTKDAARSTEEETKTVKATLVEMQARLQDAQDESRAAQDKLASLAGDVEDRENALLQQLEQHRTLLVAVTQQYGALASHSVLTETHDNLRHAHNALQFRHFRLERKLGNSEAQVAELTQLFRQVKEDNNMLKSILRVALQELSFLRKSDASPSPSPDTTEDRELSATIDHIHAKLHKERLQLADIDTNTHKLLAAFYKLKSHDLRFASSVLSRELDVAQALAEQRSSDLASALASHEVIAMRVESIQKEKTALEEELKAAVGETDALKVDAAILEARVGEMEEEMRLAGVRHASEVKKDKELVQRLTTAVQKNRMVEEALRAEIEQLTAELTEAERFQEAYYGLSDQIGDLLTRNHVAEEEAESIRKFNAEILGHNNPAQRIMYVDRIRRELAEAKHKIATLDREQENVALENDRLQNELYMYKSVQVPLDSKPRAHITRVARAPLVNLASSLNVNAGSQQASVASSKSRSQKSATSSFKAVYEAVNEGDMTTDELL